jgi:hypothetical protein
MKNVYVVQCSSGSYEDYHWWIAGIFFEATAAEELKSKIEADIETAKNSPPPFDEDSEFLTDEQKDVLANWLYENDRALDFNAVKVVEYQIQG